MINYGQVQIGPVLRKLRGTMLWVISDRLGGLLGKGNIQGGQVRSTLFKALSRLRRQRTNLKRPLFRLLSLGIPGIFGN